MPEASDPENGRLDQYLRFVRAQPHLFENTDGSGFFVLTNEADIRRVEEEVRRRLVASGQPLAWSRIGLLYEDQYIRVFRDAVRFPDGSLGTYVRILGHEGTGDGVAILPVMEGKVLLLRHFRHATRGWHLEIPRGFGAGDATADENATRELGEEIGAKPRVLLYLGSLHVDTGLIAQPVRLYYAEVDAHSGPEAIEAIKEILALPVRDFERLIASGEITDSFTLAAYAQAKLKGLL
jgi:ADP-ribose pyrophosphatase